MIDNKRIVCLANSRKLSGRCIAGREWSEEQGVGAWIRPVSERENGEVSEYERQYEDGGDPRLLDIMRVPVLGKLPVDYQTENWLLAPEYYWQKEGAYSPLDLAELADPVAPLWIDGHSTHAGRNDKIPLAIVNAVHDSLRLIRVDRLRLEVLRPGEAFGNNKRRVQGRFVHAGMDYALWITHPEYERAYLAKLDGVYEIGACYLTISLGEPHGDACYKLIAAVMESEKW